MMIKNLFVERSYAPVCAMCFVFLFVGCGSHSEEFWTRLYFNPFTEKGDVKVKADALKRVINNLVSGEKMPSILMVNIYI